MTKHYIGNAIVFPVGDDRVGMTLTIDADDLATALNRLEGDSNQEFTKFKIDVLPLKPENVDVNKTHSVKLTKLIV